ncbi:HIRAN domain-containing protein [uncultured Sphingomonas sp.]|uniref:HIRAN domain-containing protein n=1 Tax=uncultured Sphingomonas sp. TaxID=158754 RepID=UPI0035CAB568
MTELSLAVVGIDFPNPDKSRSNRRFEIALCRPGDPVELRPEPKNPADPRAVAVHSERGIRIGYVTAERCGLIGKWLRDGEECRAVFQEAGRTHAVVRARFGGGEPTLPTRGEAAEPDEYAQPDWDDG